MTADTEDHKKGDQGNGRESEQGQADFSPERDFVRGGSCAKHRLSGP